MMAGAAAARENYSNMHVKAIKYLHDDEWLAATMTLEPQGTLILKVKRNLGYPWTVRKSRGEATLAVRVTPEGRTYHQDELQSLAQVLAAHEFLGVGSSGQLLFDQGVEAQPTANLEPRDLLDNSHDVICYTSDVPIPGVRRNEDGSS